jgi:hypothetical protein
VPASGGSRPDFSHGSSSARSSALVRGGQVEAEVARFEADQEVVPSAALKRVQRHRQHVNELAKDERAVSSFVQLAGQLGGAAINEP